MCFSPLGLSGWLGFLKVGLASDAATDPELGQQDSFLFSPSHCQLQLSHRGTIEKRRGCCLNGKNKLESLPPPHHTASPTTSLPPTLLLLLPKTRHLHLTGPLFSSLHRPFSFSFSFSLPVLSIILLSPALPAKCSCCSRLDIFFLSRLMAN